MRRLSLAVLATVLVAQVVIPLAVNVASDTRPDWLTPFTPLALPLACILAVALALIAGDTIKLIPGAGPVWRDARGMDRAITQLAAAVHREWTHESAARLLHRLTPLPVRWSATGRPVAATPDRVLGRNAIGGRPLRLKLRGDVSQIVTLFTALPHRQLVILGEPGAGKTVLAILLTLGLLDRRRGRRDPVPLLLPVASWNPRTEHLRAWIARRLREDYRDLANIGAYGRDAALRLVEDGHVLPILDGLDEMPAALRQSAIDAIDQAVAGGKPLVVTCRSREYEEAVIDGGHFLATAAVIELEAVPVPDAIEYLSTSLPTVDRRWAPVFTHLRANPRCPLAETLSTPLMISLVCIAYDRRSTDPAELLNRNRFPSRAAIESHLLDVFLSISYSRFPAPPSSFASRAVPSPYGIEQAQITLTFLARHMHRLQTRYLVWWELHSIYPELAVRLFGGLAAGLLTWALIASQGVLSVLLAAIVTLIVFLMGPPDSPNQVALHGWTGQGDLRSRAAMWVVGGLTAATTLMLFFGYTAQGRLLALVAVSAGLSLGLMTLLNAAADVIRSPDPGHVLARDRTAAIIQAALTELVAGVSFAVTNSIIGAFPSSWTWQAGFVLASTISVPQAFRSAWPWFLMCNAWLALRRGLPWNLMRFLDDAHRLGVVRQAGAFYQFRHAHLQDHLAGGVRLVMELVPAALQTPELAYSFDIRTTIKVIHDRSVAGRRTPRAVPVRRDLFGRMTDPARRALVLAAERARSMHSDQVDAEHILLGILQEGTGTAATALSRLGISAEQFGGLRSNGVPDESPSIPFTAGSRAAIIGALREALLRGDEWIGTPHLLLGVLRDPHGGAAQVIAGLDITRDRILGQLRAEWAGERTPTAAAAAEARGEPLK
ncbi:hypothetical protein Lesp02_05650 [Lentzea sp. NBRC 105346]|uniref:Clp protease N-terminal domain-containing protein n=1 Tax=Lentzea sp. NBRC 105346 TaxID=3032205 RepID=UPI0024A46FA0|nr:Clp protease N-terminal domain-containing protein [Lentzea sp. NBRC 105346]GLZ28375.1 hypothetical protein Lesp02_05650 [Lentzea sp. NBRC 105346]